MTTTCKGSWLLGTACGDCDRCRETAPDAARSLFDLLHKSQKVTVSEWDALWGWHNKEQYDAAAQEDYSVAQGHKDRAAEIRPLTSFGQKETGK